MEHGDMSVAARAILNEQIAQLRIPVMGCPGDSSVAIASIEFCRKST
jgi:hypothetical protein